MVIAPRGQFPGMPDLHPDDARAGIEKSIPHSPVLRRPWRGQLITVAWSAAVVIATAGWLYFIVRAGWALVGWLIG
jgi:hypothetical protein